MKVSLLRSFLSVMALTALTYGSSVGAASGNGSPAKAQVLRPVVPFETCALDGLEKRVYIDLDPHSQDVIGYKMRGAGYDPVLELLRGLPSVNNGDLVLEIGPYHNPLGVSPELSRSRYIAIDLDARALDLMSRNSELPAHSTLVQTDLNKLSKAEDWDKFVDWVGRKAGTDGAAGMRPKLAILSSVLNYLDYKTVIPRVWEMLAPDGVLLLGNTAANGTPEHIDANPNRPFGRYSVIEYLMQRFPGQFEVLGYRKTDSSAIAIAIRKRPSAGDGYFDLVNHNVHIQAAGPRIRPPRDAFGNELWPEGENPFQVAARARTAAAEVSASPPSASSDAKPTFLRRLFGRPKAEPVVVPKTAPVEDHGPEPLLSDLNRHILYKRNWNRVQVTPRPFGEMVAAPGSNVVSLLARFPELNDIPKALEDLVRQRNLPRLRELIWAVDDDQFALTLSMLLERGVDNLDPFRSELEAEAIQAARGNFLWYHGFPNSPTGIRAFCARVSSLPESLRTRLDSAMTLPTLNSGAMWRMWEDPASARAWIEHAPRSWLPAMRANFNLHARTNEPFPPADGVLLPERAIFAHALEIDDPGSRARYLESALVAFYGQLHHPTGTTH